MRLPARIVSFLACLALLAAASAARAGSDAADGHDDNNPDEAPPFWGFVKDDRGVPVRDAKVTASHKNNLTLVTRSSATGSYRVRGFQKGINLDDVTISCSKDGYKQIRVFRHPPPRGKPVKSVETECRLQRN